MRTRYEEVDGRPSFVLSDLTPAEQAACRDLAYEERGRDFRKIFAATTNGVEEIYARFATVAPRMLGQTTGAEAVPWDFALHALAERLTEFDVDWWLCGSAALAVRGADVTPRDIDVVTDTAGAGILASALCPDLIEPPTESDAWIARWFGRAFLGARVEWVGDVAPTVDAPHVTDFGPAAAASLEAIMWEGLQLRVPPLYLQLYSATRRGLEDRVAAIAELFRR
jgi:hypothetical protein